MTFLKKLTAATAMFFAGSFYGALHGNPDVIAAASRLIDAMKGAIS